MTTTDHREDAETNLTLAAGSVIGSPEEQYYLGAAHVHATLALVEQQRITNLIAVARTRRAEELQLRSGSGAYTDRNGTRLSQEEMRLRTLAVADLVHEGLGL